MKPHLKGAKWESGFASAILDITKVLSERGGKLEPENNSNSSDLLILLGVFSAIMCLGFYLEKIRKDKMAQLTRGREALNSLIHDAKSAEHKVYMTTSCPMCLENFDPETPSREIPPASTAGAPKTLPCGHVFCEPCIQQYLNTNATNCPVCRETIRHIDDGAPAVHEQAQGSASRHGYNNREHYTYMQMMMFRTRRIRNRYPTAMDASTHSVLEAAAHSGSLSDAITVVERRSIEVQTMIADMKKASTSSSGGGSSRSSFGGGRSSGGRGGRF